MPHKCLAAFLLLVASLFAGCASQPVATIELTGTPGAPVTG